MTTDTTHKANKRSTHRQRLFLGLACLFLLLGLGNMLFGTMKAREYRSFLRQAQSELKQSGQSIVPLVGSTINFDSETRHINQLKSRLDYYKLVILGGKIFLAISGLLLLLFIITTRADDDEDP